MSAGTEEHGAEPPPIPPPVHPLSDFGLTLSTGAGNYAGFEAPEVTYMLTALAPMRVQASTCGVYTDFET